MGCSISCSTFEKFSSFLEWEIKRRTASEDIDHYLDDFIFVALTEPLCQDMMHQFATLCNEISVPIAYDKTVGPATCLTYLGYELDSERMEIRIPKQKVSDILKQINEFLSHSKVTLRQLQSLTGSLAFCAKAMPSARAFIRRLYSAMSKVKKSFHKIRVTKGIKEDIKMWNVFLTEYNGFSVMLDNSWTSSFDLQLFTDSAGSANLGCGAYFQGHWAFLQWPKPSNKSKILSDITFLELIPIALSCFLWCKHFCGLRIKFRCDNEAVVQILNSKTSKSERVMTLVRCIVLWSMQFDFYLKAEHIMGVKNKVVDSISRMQGHTFRRLAPEADVLPTQIPQEFWTFLPKN